MDRNIVVMSIILLGISLALIPHLTSKSENGNEIQVRPKKRILTIITFVILMFVLASAFFFKLDDRIVIGACVVGFVLDMINMLIK